MKFVNHAKSEIIQVINSNNQIKIKREYSELNPQMPKRYMNKLKLGLEFV